MSFCEELKNKMSNKRLYAMDLASYLGCNTETVRHWIKGQELPSKIMEDKLVELFGIDRINRAHNNGLGTDIPFFNGEKLKLLMKEENLSVQDLSDCSGIPTNSIYRYMASYRPNRKALDSINDVFDKNDEYWSSPEETAVASNVTEDIDLSLVESETISEEKETDYSPIDCLNEVLNEFILRVKDVEAKIDILQQKSDKCFKDIQTLKEGHLMLSDNVKNSEKDLTDDLGRLEAEFRSLKSSLNTNDDVNILAKALATTIIKQGGASL